jgi:hypothetical protein
MAVISKRLQASYCLFFFYGVVLCIETALAKNLLMQARVMADSEPVSSRAEAVGLLQELNHPVYIYLKYRLCCRTVAYITINISFGEGLVGLII